MTVLTCRVVRKMLGAFHDGELSIESQVRVEVHLDGCATCASDSQEIAEIGGILRAAVAVDRANIPDLGNVQANVVARMAVDRHLALTSRVMRVIDDPHVVWAALGATAATVVCVGVALAMLSFAAPMRADSLAGILAVLSSPGSNENPVRPAAHVTFPRVDRRARPGLLLRTVADRQEDVFALAAVLTREGRLIDLEVLEESEEHRHDTLMLLDVASTTRFEPAMIGQEAVAVSVVWVMVHTTVMG